MKKMISTLITRAAFAFALAFGLTAQAGEDIVIHEGGSVTYGGGDASTYSDGNYYAITKAGNFGDTVSAIRTEGNVANVGTSITFTGVRGINNGASTLKISSMPGGIAVTNNGWIGAINQQSSIDTEGSSDLDVSGVGDISVKSTGSSYGAKGIGAYSAVNPDITQNKINVSAKSLTVEAEGTAYGFQGTLAGRTTTVNVEGAVTVRGVGSSGKAYGSNFTAATSVGQAEWDFGSFVASSENSFAYGFHCVGGLIANVNLNGDMTVTGLTYGIGFRFSGNADFTVKGQASKEIDITVSSTSYYSLGADVGNSNTSTAKLNLDVNNFTVASANAVAYGLYAEASKDAAITADIKNLSVSAGTDAYAICTKGGAITILNSATITAQGSTSSQAVCAFAGSTVTFSNNVTLVGDVTNAGTIAIGVYSGKPSIALTGAFNNTGTLAVDMTGADTTAEYTLVDDTNGGENTYGAVSLPSGWGTMVVDGDLIATNVAWRPKANSVTVELPEVAGATAQLLAFNVNGGWASVATNEVPSNATVRVVWTVTEDGKALSGAGAVSAFQWQTELVAAESIQTAPAPMVVEAGASEITISLDTRTTKAYYAKEDILPIWAAQGAEVEVEKEGGERTTLVKSSATTNTLTWLPAEQGTYNFSQNGFNDAQIIYTTPVEVTTNGLEVAGTIVEVTVDGTALPEDGIVASNSVVAATWTATAPGVYFMNGTTTYTQTFTADKAVNAAREAVEMPEEPAAPKVKLGVVAQRYPWDGKLDVQYWAQNTPNEGYQITVTITLPDGKTASETQPCKNGKNTVAFNAREKFGEVQFTSGVKVKATLLPPSAK